LAIVSPCHISVPFSIGHLGNFDHLHTLIYTLSSGNQDYRTLVNLSK
jgi:hypothetical protein